MNVMNVINEQIICLLFTDTLTTLLMFDLGNPDTLFKLYEQNRLVVPADVKVCLFWNSPWVTFWYKIFESGSTLIVNVRSPGSSFALQVIITVSPSVTSFLSTCSSGVFSPVCMEKKIN